MQLFSGDATIFLKTSKSFFCPENMKQRPSKAAHSQPPSGDQKDLKIFSPYIQTVYYSQTWHFRFDQIDNISISSKLKSSSVQFIFGCEIKLEIF